MTFSNLSRMSFVISDKQKKFLKEVDDICRSIRQDEEKCYLEEKLNEKIIPEFGKIGMLGCPISRRYGGLGYDILTYVLAIERIGEEGNSLRSFFSAHTSIGQMVLQGWADEAQKQIVRVSDIPQPPILGIVRVTGGESSALLDEPFDFGSMPLLILQRP